MARAAKRTSFKACAAIASAVTPCLIAQSAMAQTTRTLVSSNFSIGLGNTDGINPWDDLETAAANTPTTQGDFSFVVTASSPNNSSSGCTFVNRVMGPGTTGNYSGYTGDQGFHSTITGSYAGAAPADAAATPNFQLAVRIEDIGLYWCAYANPLNPFGWAEETPGHAALSPQITDFPGSNNANVPINYTHLTWNPDDYNVPLAGLNDTFDRKFTPASPDLTDGQIDGFEVSGNVLLTYEVTGSFWNTDANGNSNAAGNWTGGIPNAADAFALFGPVITAARTVTVNAAHTIGGIKFDNANSYTVAGASMLTMDVTNNQAVIEVANGSHTISAPLTLSDNTAFLVAPSSVLTVSNLQSSTVKLTKMGAGVLEVNTLNTFGLDANNGTVRLTAAGGSANRVAIGPSGTLDLNGFNLTAGQAGSGFGGSGNITLGAGTLTIDSGGTFTGVISGSGGIVKSGTGTLTLLGDNSYTGNTAINGGVVEARLATNIGDVSNTLSIDNGGTFRALRDMDSPNRKVTIGAGGGTIDTNGFDVRVGVVDPGPLTKNGGDTLTVTRLENMPSVTINAGEIQVAPSSLADGVSKVSTLTIATGARLDLTDNKLITANPAGTWDGTAYTGVSGMVDAGRGPAGNALWDGTTGIITSDTRAIENGDLVSIGVAKVGVVKGIADTATTTFAGQTVLGSDTIAMVTWGGDANLDGKINIDDYGQIDSNVSKSGTVFGWNVGDFNYDGVINIDDYGIIDGNIGRQDSVFPTAGGAAALAATAVPEPAAPLAAVLCLGLSLRRRRRSRPPLI